MLVRDRETKIRKDDMRLHLTPSMRRKEHVQKATERERAVNVSYAPACRIGGTLAGSLQIAARAGPALLARARLEHVAFGNGENPCTRQICSRRPTMLPMRAALPRRGIRNMLRFIAKFAVRIEQHAVVPRIRIDAETSGCRQVTGYHGHGTMHGANTHSYFRVRPRFWPPLKKRGVEHCLEKGVEYTYGDVYSIVAAPMHAPSRTSLLLPLLLSHNLYQSPSPPRSLVRYGQTSPHRPRLVVSRSTRPPLSLFPHTNSLVLRKSTHKIVSIQYCCLFLKIRWVRTVCPACGREGRNCRALPTAIMAIP